MVDWREIHIDTLELSVRTSNVLSRNGLLLLGQIAAMSDSDLFRLGNFGRKSLNEIREKIADVSNIPVSKFHSTVQRRAHLIARISGLNEQLRLANLALAGIDNA
jgi:DNA-directed RNA polymerase alpha subunit